MIHVKDGNGEIVDAVELWAKHHVDTKILLNKHGTIPISVAANKLNYGRFLNEGYYMVGDMTLKATVELWLQSDEFKYLYRGSGESANVAYQHQS